MSYPQHYKTLGVNPKASPEEIRTAYHKLVKKYHPDTHKGDKKSEEKLKAINEAYNVLKDWVKRAEYDYLGRQAAENMQTVQKNAPFTGTAANSPLSEEMRKFTRKQRIKWIITKVVLVAFFVAYLAFLRTQANPDRPYDLLTTLHNSSLTFRRTVQNGADYAVAKAKNIYHNEHWRAKILFFAVRHNYKTMLEYFLQYFSANTVDEVSGESLLMATDDVEMAKLLLDYGADVNYVSKEGNTALLAAVKSNNVEMVEVLLQAGANPSIILPNGESLIKIAARQNSAKIVSLLVKYKVKIPWHKVQKKP